MENTKIEKQWRTTEINPEEFVAALRAELEPLNDGESLYTLRLNYGTGNNVILKLHPQEKIVIAAIPAETEGFIQASKIFDISEIVFMQYPNPENGNLETDISVHSRGGMSLIIFEFTDDTIVWFHSVGDHSIYH